MTRRLNRQFVKVLKCHLYRLLQKYVLVAQLVSLKKILNCNKHGCWVFLCVCKRIHQMREKVLDIIYDYFTFEEVTHLTENEVDMK